MLGLQIDHSKRRRWFLWLLLFFLAANLTGTVRYAGKGGTKVVGFPVIFVTWGSAFGEQFLPHRLLINVLSAAMVSSTLSWLLALKRSPHDERADGVGGHSLPGQTSRLDPLSGEAAAATCPPPASSAP